LADSPSEQESSSNLNPYPTIMNITRRRTMSWQLGMALGAVAFGFVSLPAVFAGSKGKVCSSSETLLCNKNGHSTCVKTTEVSYKLSHGYFCPTNGSCPADNSSSST
jgi:hypothetical protein